MIFGAIDRMLLVMVLDTVVVVKIDRMLLVMVLDTVVVKLLEC